MSRLPSTQIYRIAFVVLFTAVLSFTAPAHADSTISLYDGEPLSQAASSIAPWGGGAVSDTDQASYAPGKHSVVVNVNGPYQGGVFTPATPIPLGDPTSDKTRYIQIGFSFSTAQPPPPPKAPRQRNKDGLPDQIGSARSRSLFHLAQLLAQAPGGQPGGQPGDPNAVAAPVAPPPPAIQNLHLILTLADGSGVEFTRAVPAALTGSSWITMGVPLVALPWTPAQTASAQLASLTITGDGAGPVYVGFVKITSDSLPITESISGDSEISVTGPGNYTSVVSAGSSNVTWTWDAHDGTPVEHGQTFSHTFPKAGVYNISLTIADIDGLKAPTTTTYKVVVQSF